MRVARLAPALLVASLLIAPLAIVDVAAQTSGERPLHILVGFAPGGTTDVLARLIAERITRATGRTVIIENRPGAGGRIAAADLKRAAADGNTLLLTPMVTIVLAPLVSRRLQYDPLTDFAPVAHVADFQNVFAVKVDHPARNIAEFVAGVKARGGGASFGTAAAGSQPHFFGAMIAAATGIELVHVPFKGAAPLAADIASGQIEAGISGLSDFLALHRAGRLRIIATSGASRSPLLPDVPTFQEQGFTAMQTNGWLALYAPAGTPKPTIDRWSKDVVQVVRAAEMRARLVDLGLEPTGTTPEELAAIMARDTVRWAPIVKATGFAGD